MVDVYVMEYYTAMRISELRFHATIWINLPNVMLTERNQTEKSTVYNSIYREFISSMVLETRVVVIFCGK